MVLATVLAGSSLFGGKIAAVVPDQRDSLPDPWLRLVFILVCEVVNGPPTLTYLYRGWLYGSLMFGYICNHDPDWLKYMDSSKAERRYY